MAIIMDRRPGGTRPAGPTGTLSIIIRRIRQALASTERRQAAERWSNMRPERAGNGKIRIPVRIAGCSGGIMWPGITACDPEEHSGTNYVINIMQEWIQYAGCRRPGTEWAAISTGRDGAR